MNIPAQFFSRDWLALANILFGWLVFSAVRGADWKKTLVSFAHTNALVLLTLGAFAFWQLNAGVRPGHNFHVLGATLFTLIFGWRIGLLLLTGVMAATWAVKGLDWIALGMNGLLMLGGPILFTLMVLALARRYLPKNFFVFVLGNGFFCAGISTAIMSTTGGILLFLLSHYTWTQIEYFYLAAMPIMAFEEAILTGFVLTSFTVSLPEVVYHFSYEEYLAGK